MPAIITNKFRLHNTSNFVESFSESSPNIYYLAIGRPQAFATSTGGDSRTQYEGTDSSPLTPADSVSDEFYFFDDVIAAKRITTSDISRVIPRRNWTTGTTYDMYRGDYGQFIKGSTSSTITANSGATSLADATFYVLSSANHVYKVISNNGNAASTVEPTGTSTSILTTGDSYKWKYMYSLTASEQTNFLSTDFMHVSTDTTVAAAAVDGAIDTVLIKTAGSSGTNGSHTSVAIRGDGSSGACTVVVSGGAVSSVTVTTAGTGYTFGYIRNADIVAAGATNLSGSELDVIIPPKGGHGKDAVEELGGHFVMMNTNFTGDESSNSGDFTTANDFRRVGLLLDPQTGGSAASATTLRGTKAVKLTGTPGSFQVDEEINQASTGAVGKVVEYDSTNKILYYIQTRFNDEGVDSNGNQTALSGANAITGQTSSAAGTPDASTQTVDNIVFSSGYNSGEIDADTDVLYQENRSPITRASDQTENIKLIVEF
jgi:hypothetical protein